MQGFSEGDIWIKTNIVRKGGNSLVVQWVGLRAFTAEGAGSNPGQETKIPQAVQRGQK